MNEQVSRGVERPIRAVWCERVATAVAWSADRILAVGGYVSGYVRVPRSTRRRVMKFLTLGEIMARLPEVDDRDVVERLAGDRALRAALELFRPTNWHGSGIAAERLLEISANDGVPLARVPQFVVTRVPGSRG